MMTFRGRGNARFQEMNPVGNGAETVKTLLVSSNRDEYCVEGFLLVNYRSCVTGYLAVVNNNSNTANHRRG